MPYIQEPLPVVSTPPMREWTLLQLPYDGSITEIKHINMRNLQEMYCDYNQMTTLPWDELQNLYYLGIYNCAFITLELWQMPNLYSCYAGDNYNLESVDAHDMPNLGDLDIYYCQSLTNLDVSGCSNLRYIYAYGCAFDEAMVDQLLTDLVANGTTNGYLQVNGPYNSPPSNPDGVALKNILISRGWSVYTS
ncbi:MAG TPA: hypothetical protein P5316_16375 [Phycisphaerae bacterium]|nr:hypothetical protein [Phycisphaerae bacterium]